MHDENRALRRERRAAWFIALAMLAATIYIVSQGGLLSGLFSGGDDENALPPFRHGQYRRAVTLPLDFAAQDAGARSAAFAQMQDYGINWVEIPLPVWNATARNLEYSSFDFRAAAALARECRDHGLGVTLLPLHWNGDTLSPAPVDETASAFLQGYRVLLLDCADLAASCGADAILFDALFGASGVSAGEWLALIEELRTRYGGALEARMSGRDTPLLYLRHLDGAHIPPDSLRAIELRREAPDAAIYLRLPLRDRYAAGALPWQLHNVKVHYDPDAVMRVLHTAEQQSFRGFTLSGGWAWTNVTVDNTPLGKLLRAQREHAHRRELERRRMEVAPGNE
ncbi:MAG: hypothetical protein RRA94_10345 [Bacteroidota bacterium]|nr:hypothetical protein [Bacteroidota bacterium]